ncbi:hypothetical protein N7471_001550 [Penicillium samsonianum]|uniref:uncharacterized protein n=1 Tax=Penicillium samsonianum TaxID=1882272 RepID=UPI002548DCB5|nr:uncharacterized protein N7471_001550 [Penicillium samsonianum]KAJ6150351.1 hypothetical protein N7471_001550 [Penicillium samsonianum]
MLVVFPADPLSPKWTSPASKVLDPGQSDPTDITEYARWGPSEQLPHVSAKEEETPLQTDTSGLARPAAGSDPDLADRGASTPSFHCSQVPPSIGSDGEGCTHRQSPPRPTTRKRDPLPNEEIYDGMADENIERNWSVDTADLHFNGKADELPKVLMHIRLESALDSDLQDSAVSPTRGLKTERCDRLVAAYPADYSALKREAARIEAPTTVAPYGAGFFL